MPVNMSHCRMTNTRQALTEAREDLDATSSMSAEERRERDRLLVLCKQIADDFEDEIAEIIVQQRREKANV